MAKTLLHTRYSIFESRDLSILYAGLYSILKSSLAFPTASEPKTILTEHLKYDSGEIDLRPTARIVNSSMRSDQCQTLDVMLLRAF